jgi:hypothetical protein
MLFILGIVFAFIALMCLLAVFDGEGSAIWGVLVCGGIAALCFKFGAPDNAQAQPAPTVQVQVQQGNDEQKKEEALDQKAKEAETQSDTKADNTYTEDTPEDTAARQAGAERTVHNARIVCDDGVQIKIAVWIDSNDRSVSLVTSWPRLHTNGKPYTCSESKEPAQEVSL